MVRKVLVTGASGLLGRAILNEFKDNSNWQVLGLAFSRVRNDLRQVDICDRQAVNQVISDFKPDVIIHSAAERKVDVFDKMPETAMKMNVDGTKFICEAAAAVNAWVLYISTDYVFDGTKPPYKVTDEPNPLNLYGQSKLEGEKVTLHINNENCVLRVPILYGQVEHLAESAVTVLFEKVKDISKTAKMCDYQRRFPTHCADVAYVISQLSKKQLQDSSIKGIYHWSGDENMTKYDMALIMASKFGISTNHIEADQVSSVGSNRPHNAQLDCSRILELQISKQTKFSDAIGDILKPFY